MHAYRTHTAGALRAADAGQIARLSGWVHARRDHGGLLFIDLRDHYGITQCVFAAGSPVFAAAEAVRPESVVTVTGTVVAREEGTLNPRLPTGEVELRVTELAVQSAAEVLPMQVAGEEKFPEDIRLRYRFIDLRREKIHRNMMLRANVIASIRRRMIEAGFTEFQTPILTASSPEGARDFLVPARMHPGKFYALPQAPQQFKQLLMVAGFDRYFQIAPCFRDEASRADRSPGEFYQLDFEMSYVTQEDVFATIEPVIAGVFEEFGDGRTVTPTPFPQIPYDTAMLEYGSDKPDLRNPSRIRDVTAHFSGSGFGLFARIAAAGGIVRAVPAPGAAAQPRSFFDKLNEWARVEGQGGLGYIIYGDGLTEERKIRSHQFNRADPERIAARGEIPLGTGPIARHLTAEQLVGIADQSDLNAGDAVFFVAGKKEIAEKFAGVVRNRIADELNLSEKVPFGSAGSPTSRCTRSTRRPNRSISVTTRSACRKADWKRSRRGIR
jgi:aspartyl-tRNA synthetase